MANSKTLMTVLAVLILAPDINDLGHVALFVTPKRWTRVVTFFLHRWLRCSCIRVVRVYIIIIVLQGWNWKNFNRLTFHKRKFLLFGWQRTPLCILLDLSYLWPTKCSGMWPRECTFLVWQTKPHDSNHKHLVPKSTVTRISEFVVQLFW